MRYKIVWMRTAFKLTADCIIIIEWTRLHHNCPPLLQSASNCSVQLAYVKIWVQMTGRLCQLLGTYKRNLLWFINVTYYHRLKLNWIYIYSHYITHHNFTNVQCSVSSSKITQIHFIVKLIYYQLRVIAPSSHHQELRVEESLSWHWSHIEVAFEWWGVLVVVVERPPTAFWMYEVRDFEFRWKECRWCCKSIEIELSTWKSFNIDFMNLWGLSVRKRVSSSQC